MILKIGGLVCGLILLGLGVTFVKPQQENWKEKNSIQSVARRTKAEGKSAVVVAGPRVDYGGGNMTLQEALALYSVFVAEPSESKTYMKDADHIVTWYRFSIKETLSAQAPLVCDTCPQPDEAPADMLPVKPGEFLVSKIGGTTTVSGVQVTMTDLDLPQYEVGKEYLIFASVTPTGVAMIGGGPAGVFKISDGNKLEGLTKKTTPLQSELRNRFNLKLSGFRAHAKP